MYIFEVLMNYMRSFHPKIDQIDNSHLLDANVGGSISSKRMQMGIFRKKIPNVIIRMYLGCVFVVFLESNSEPKTIFFYTNCLHNL